MKYKIESEIEKLDSEGAVSVRYKKMPERMKYDSVFNREYNKIEKIIQSLAEKGLVKKAKLKITFEIK